MLTPLSEETRHYLLVKHAASLKKCIGKIKNGQQTSTLSYIRLLSQLDNVSDPGVKAFYRLINMYCYLEQRAKEGEKDRDYIGRKEDFLNQLEKCVNKDKSAFSPNKRFNNSGYSCCFYRGSNRYYDQMIQLQDSNNANSINKSTLDLFYDFLALQNNNSLVQDLKNQLKLPARPTSVNNITIPHC